MWMIICIIVAVILLGWIGIGYVGFKTAICRGHELDINDREALKGTAWDQYYDEIQEGIVWISQQEAEDIYIQSEDGLKLHARLMDQSGAKGTVLMFHGYRTHPEVDFSASSYVYYECGNRIVHIDQRAAGESEGKYIGFGVLESRDCCLWAQYIANRFGTDQKIILAGLSMGASTVLMATAHHEDRRVRINCSPEEPMEVSMTLPKNVTGIVADSAFSSPYDIIKKRIRTTYHCNGRLLTIAIGIWSRMLAHYSLKELSVPDVMKHNTIPVLLVHGTEDSNVPVEMTVKIAENCQAPKQVLLVKGAEHGTGYLVDNEAYKKALQEFCS
ncbi:alpha/beta hydrolase [uncultured Eubacterium sp.]|uniref:alpha/beta hydrolase n=1 Tax=uncultured Eubacterium sp. TaxID=165185 RepID=UPI0015AE069B|nr:alpha/beta hydrolase [uncultured Eubacterium sp.]